MNIVSDFYNYYRLNINFDDKNKTIYTINDK
jgi:hypothetical protein